MNYDNAELLQQPINRQITEFYHYADIESAKEDGSIVYLWLKGGSLSSLQIDPNHWDGLDGAFEIAEWLAWEITDAIAIGSQGMLESSVTQSGATWGHYV
jgi:hypothetical protein